MPETTLPKDFGAYGIRATGRLRVRNRFLLGAVIEQMMEFSDGTSCWVRCTSAKEIAAYITPEKAK